VSDSDVSARPPHTPCEHFVPEPGVAPPLDVCSVCVPLGAWWVHLRQCLTCGLTSCCDDSPNRHASTHSRETGHPMIRSAEPGEDWWWCFVDDLAYVPGPDGYVVFQD
jgi:uncharacterized UBP type Zn finger protein